MDPEDTNIKRMTSGDPFYARPKKECSYCNVNPCYACILKRSAKPQPKIEEKEDSYSVEIVFDV